MFGFNLKPSGNRYGTDGTYNLLGIEFDIWSSGRYDWWRSGDKFISDYVNNNAQLSIRLVKDAT
jgi:hypothetical protein